jgi:hypothetical protein
VITQWTGDGVIHGSVDTPKLEWEMFQKIVSREAHRLYQKTGGPPDGSIVVAASDAPPLKLAGFEVRKGVTGWIVMLNNGFHENRFPTFHAFTTWVDMLAWMVATLGVQEGGLPLDEESARASTPPAD